MAKKLTAAEAAFSRALLHDLFEAGGILKYPIREEGRNYIKEYAPDEAKTICNEIKFRTFDFLNVDYAIKSISSCWIYPLRDPGKAKRLEAESIANIIAAFCAELEIFWDDVNTHRTSTELETYRKSFLGKACWEFECFLSQQETKAPDKFAAKYAAKRGTTKAPKAPRSTTGSAPKSGYKSSGAKSSVIKGLIGKPGEKTTFSTHTLLYSILCKSTKAKPQFAFIDPVSTLADPNVVRLGDPSGYTACKLFFKSIEEAEAAIAKIKSSIAIPDHISAFTPAKGYADANGYFLVKTEIGPAYIKARKLNETVSEDLDETEEFTATPAKFPKINDIETYNEAFFRE
jgi:hypothetical protein